MFSYYVQKDFAHLAGAGSYYVSLLILDGINPALDTERENHWLAIHLHVSSDCDRVRRWLSPIRYGASLRQKFGQTTPANKGGPAPTFMTNHQNPYANVRGRQTSAVAP